MTPLRTALLALAAAAALPPADTFDYHRLFEVPARGSGTWSGRFAAAPGEGELVGLAVVADWWEGPGDGRVGDAKKTAMEGVVYELKRGDGPWTPLPPANRDLRLQVRAEAPPDAKALLGGKPGGEWSVRQVAGGAYPRSVRLEFTCRGDALFVTDLRVKSFSLPGRDPEPVVGRPHIPDRTGNPTLKPGDTVDVVVVVENSGARKTKEVDLDLVLARFGERRGTRLAFVQVPKLAPGETVELKISGTIPEDAAAETGAYEVLAVVDPRNTLREVETLDNALGRAFLLEVPPKKNDGLPDDLRDR